jgi:hypothetical protein
VLQIPESHFRYPGDLITRPPFQTKLITFEQMRKLNLTAAGLSFLMCLIAMYFGSSIFNAKENMLIGHLNEMDQLDYYDVRAIPLLNRLAAILTIPFVTAIAVVESWIAIKSKIRPVKNVARGLMIAFIALFILDIFVIAMPENFDFSQWGFFWVIFGITAVGGNLFSVFVPGNKTNEQT